MLAADFSHEMLAIGRRKFTGHNIVAMEADALNLPLEDGSVDLVTAAFGFLQSCGLSGKGCASCIHRILRPGGEIAILEFNQPAGLMGFGYNTCVLSVAHSARWLVELESLHSQQSYAYLPSSVARFPQPKRMLELIGDAGFVSAMWTSYTFGVAGLYRAVRNNA